MKPVMTLDYDKVGGLHLKQQVTGISVLPFQNFGREKHYDSK